MRRPLVVVVFLRGGADGLALVPPAADARLEQLRPSVTPEPSSLVPAGDGRHGLHPALAPIAPLLANGEAAIVLGVGSDDGTRSHFEAQDRMEQAGPNGDTVASGWIARHLATREGPRPGPLAAVSFGAMVPDSLRGVSATAVEKLSDLVPDRPAEETLSALARLYGSEAQRGAVHLSHELGGAGCDAIEVARSLRALTVKDTPARAHYGPGQLGDRFAEAAVLMRNRADLGLEVVTIDHQGWDTHFVQAGALDENARSLALCMRGLRDDLAEQWSETTVVVVTEFGRRVRDNVSRGTDHGRASLAIVAGGALARGGVIGGWPDLDDASLEGPGDLPVTVDYRSILWEVVETRLGNRRVGEVFPGFAPA